MVQSGTILPKFLFSTWIRGKPISPKRFYIHAKIQEVIIGLLFSNYFSNECGRKQYLRATVPQITPLLLTKNQEKLTYIF